MYFSVMALAVSSALLAAGCSQGASSVVAKAGATEVTVADVRSIVAELPQQTREALAGNKAALERIVRSEIVRRAVLAEAKEARFDADAKVQQQLDRVRDDAVVRLWIAKQGTVADGYPSEEDLKLAYESNQAALTPPAQYRVAQIFISAPNGIDAEHLAVAMRKAAEVGSKIPGGDFAALAHEYSEHAESAAKGGDVGLLPADRMLPEIVTAIARLEPGAVTGPVKTSQGLHYVKLLEKKEGAPLTFESARPQLVAALRARRSQEMQQAYLASLDSKLSASVDQIALAQLDTKSK
jgi:peptidylprolyl isomerase